MPNTPKTKAELVIEKIMQQLDPASSRYQVLNVARQFKSSWVELGEQLTRVRNSGEFSNWGYGSFDDYCREEVRIKKETALKLTCAFSFLEKEEPEILARSRRMLPVPDYRSIDLLRQAQEANQLNGEQYQMLREAVFEKERSHPTVAKQFRELNGQNQPPCESELLRQALLTARRLENQLQQLPQLSDHLPPCSAIVQTLEQINNPPAES
jgi:hypothetical protein